MIALNRVEGDVFFETESAIIYQRLKDSKLLRDYYDKVIGFEVPYASVDGALKDMHSDNLKVLRIIIRCTNEKTFKLIQETPIHFSHTTDAAHRRIIINVIDNNLLCNTLMSYGAGVKVIFPVEIREGIKKRLEDVCLIYKNG